MGPFLIERFLIYKPYNLIRKMAEDCVFCKIARKEIKTKLEDESANFIAFLDINPIASGHTLIVPKKHFVNLMDLPSSMGTELLDLIKKIAEKQIKKGVEGFNLVVNNKKAAGQLVMHAHLHIIPRKKGDNIRFKTI